MPEAPRESAVAVCPLASAEMLTTGRLCRSLHCMVRVSQDVGLVFKAGNFDVKIY